MPDDPTLRQRLTRDLRGQWRDDPLPLIVLVLYPLIVLGMGRWLLLALVG
jgi:hypothetical protein